jgi:cell wall-associated NlpC family hydrolase
MALFDAKAFNRWGRATALCAVLVALPVERGTAQLAKPFADLSNSALALRDSVVAIARAQIGRRYKTGGTTPDYGFDCSGLVKYVLAATHVDVPRTSRQQSLLGSAIPKDTTQLLPGDLLMFGKPKAGVSHVGIYVGHGRYIHASSVAGRVIESPLERPPSPLIKVFKTARRILVSTDTVTALAIASAGKQRQ